MAPARSADRTTWLMLNCSRRKMCLLINTKPRAPVFTVVMVAISYLTNIGPCLCGRVFNYVRTREKVQPAKGELYEALEGWKKWVFMKLRSVFL